MGGLLPLWGHLSAPLSILDVLVQSSLFNQPFDHVLELDVIIGVMVLTLMETEIFGFVCSWRLLNQIHIFHPGLLEIHVFAFLQDPLP